MDSTRLQLLAALLGLTGLVLIFIAGIVRGKRQERARQAVAALQLEHDSETCDVCQTIVLLSDCIIGQEVIVDIAQLLMLEQRHGEFVPEAYRAVCEKVVKEADRQDHYEQPAVEYCADYLASLAR